MDYLKTLFLTCFVFMLGLSFSLSCALADLLPAPRFFGLPYSSLIDGGMIVGIIALIAWLVLRKIRGK